MKYLNLTIVLCICHLATLAQQYVPMPTGKATWNYHSTTTINTTPTQYYYQYFLLIQTGDDTTINSTVYKKILKRSWDTTVTSATYNPPAGSIVANHPDVFTAGLREDNKKVYIYNDATTGAGLWRERLLFDFTVNVGDTVGHINFINWNDSLLEVKAINSVTINGIAHKRFQMKRINLGGDLEMIEGVGTDKGLISYLLVPFCYCTYDFQCFTDDNTSFGPATACSYVWPQGTPTSVTSLPEKKELSIYPVPFSNVLAVKVQSASDAALYDMMGREVLRQSLDGKPELQTGHLQPGVYFLKVSDNAGAVVHTQKLVKE